jgi:hypothetical protein
MVKPCKLVFVCVLHNNCCLKVCCNPPARQASWTKPDMTGTPHETLPASPTPAAAALLGRQLIWSSLTTCPSDSCSRRAGSGAGCHKYPSHRLQLQHRKNTVHELSREIAQPFLCATSERRSKALTILMRQLPHLPLAGWVRTLDGLVATMMSEHCSSNHQTTSAAPQRPQAKSPLIH